MSGCMFRTLMGTSSSVETGPGRLHQAVLCTSMLCRKVLCCAVLCWRDCCRVTDLHPPQQAQGLAVERGAAGDGAEQPQDIHA